MEVLFNFVLHTVVLAKNASRTFPVDKSIDIFSTPTTLKSISLEFASDYPRGKPSSTCGGDVGWGYKVAELEGVGRFPTNPSSSLGQKSFCTPT